MADIELVIKIDEDIYKAKRDLVVNPKRMHDQVDIAIANGVLFNTDKPIEKGIDLVPVGRLETQDEHLLNILKEQGFYLEHHRVLYPKEG